jgi:maleate isomerase
MSIDAVINGGITTGEPVEYIDLPTPKLTDYRDGVGLVAPFDFALDDEYWRWMPDGHPLYITRTEFNEHTIVDEQLAQDVSDAKVVVPAIRSLAMAAPGAVGYACTSGSFVNGNAGEYLLRETMSAAGAKSPVTTSGALREAVAVLGIKRLAIATPYDYVLTERLVNFLAACGVAVTKAGYLNSESDIMHIGYETVRDMAQTINDDTAEALFFSCTNLRTYDIVEELEQQLGKPVLSANQVTIWAMLRAAGLPMPRVNHRLFAGT